MHVESVLGFLFPFSGTGRLSRVSAFGYPILYMYIVSRPDEALGSRSELGSRYNGEGAENALVRLASDVLHFITFRIPLMTPWVIQVLFGHEVDSAFEKTCVRELVCPGGDLSLPVFTR